MPSDVNYENYAMKILMFGDCYGFISKFDIF